MYTNNVGWCLIFACCFVTSLPQTTDNTNGIGSPSMEVTVVVWNTTFYSLPERDGVTGLPIEDDDDDNTTKTRSNRTDLGLVPQGKPEMTVIDAVLKYTEYITVPLFLLMSISGNIITIIVMLTKEFKKSSFSVLLIALAVSDSTYTFIFPFNKLFVRELLGYDLRALSNIGCHIFFIVHKASKIDSSWFIVAIAIERFIAVWFPLKAGIICSRRNTWIVVFVLWCGILVFSSLWSFSTMVVNGVCLPNYPTPETAVLTKAYIIAGGLMYAVIPASTLLIITPVTCIKLMYQRRLRRTLTHRRRTKQDHVNVMLIMVAVAYIALVTPTSIGHMVCYTLGVSFYESKLPSVAIATAILQVMEQVNFSINFWLYVMCNISFRLRAMALIGCSSPAKDVNIKTSKEWREAESSRVTGNTMESEE